MFELLEVEDFPNHPSIVSGFDVFKEHPVMGSWSGKEGQ
jgi:hypothetical protein